MYRYEIAPALGWNLLDGNPLVGNQMVILYCAVSPLAEAAF